jgi:hypothetical protein
MRKPPIWLAVLLAALMSLPPVTLYAAITVTEAFAETTSTNGTSFTSTGTLTIASGEQAICFSNNTDAAPAEDPTSLTFSTGGQSFTKVVSATTSGTTAATESYGAIWRYTATHASSTLALAAGAGDSQTGYDLRCYVLAGSDTSAAVIQTKTGSVSNDLTAEIALDGARTASSALLSTIFTEGR